MWSLKTVQDGNGLFLCIRLQVHRVNGVLLVYRTIMASNALLRAENDVDKKSFKL